MDINILIPSLISAAVTLTICIINSRAEASKMTALISYRLEQLEKKVEKHNSIIERTFKLEEESAVQDAELKRLNKRLEIVEGKQA